MLFDEDEFRRWLDQAEHTLNSARRDRIGEDYSWSCFKAQQGAEYAIKGLLYGLGEPAFGHSIFVFARKLNEQDVEIPKRLLSLARRLDRHYIAARYPNAHPTESPFRYYDETDAREAIDAADEWVQFIIATHKSITKESENDDA